MEKRFWQKYFTRTMLERGYEYFRNDRVEDLEYRDDYKMAYAIVNGNYEYYVSVKFNDDLTEIDSMKCSCPYADDGNNCKHMAAVLFAFDDTDEKSDEIGRSSASDDKVDKTDSDTELLKNAIDELPASDIRDMLFEVAKNDEYLCDSLLIRCTKKVTPEQKKRWRSTLEQFAQTATEASEEYFDDYDYYGEAFDEAFEDMTGFMESYVKILIPLGMYSEASELIFDTYNEFEKIVNVEDYAIDIFFDYLKVIVEKSDDETAQKIFETLTAHPTFNSIIEFIIQMFDGEKYSRRLIESIDGAIDKTPADNDDTLVFLVESRCDIMARLNMSNDEIFEYRRKFKHLSQFPLHEFDHMVDHEQIDDAVQLAIEQYGLVKNNYPIKNAWFDRIKILCRNYQLNDVYEKVLLSRIETEAQRNLDTIHEFKSITPDDEWPTLRDKLWRMDNMDDVRFDFLKEEEMFDEMFDAVVTSSSTSIIWDNEKLLKKKFPYEMRDLLMKVLDDEMEHATNREMYKKAVKHLGRIESYPDGKKLAADIVLGWVTRYGRRRAMLEELEKQGYSTAVCDFEQD